MPDAAPSFVDAATALMSQIQAAAEEIERSRRLPADLVEALARAGLFRLWIPRVLGGEETDPMILVRVVEEVSRADGAAGWCVAIGGEYGAFGGYLPRDAAREIYGSDPLVRTAGAFARSGMPSARHAIDLLQDLAQTKVASRSRQALREDATMQASLGQAEAILRSARGFLYETLAEAWQTALDGETLDVTQRASFWLASMHAAVAAKQATELMFNAGGSASPYANAGLERCLRDVHAAGQHVTLAAPNYQMAGQAFLGLDMRTSLLLFMDDRSGD
jgi:alkylation response protein AidB-like acyl-CoA dehydrogenase